jgi:hypothetical protein
MKVNLHPKLIIVISMLLIGFTSCKKDKNILTAEATVVYTGSIALDGCEWLIYVDEVANNVQADPKRTYYNVVNLPENYKQNDMKITISYKLLSSRYHCGMLANSPGIPQIELERIDKK